jgi:hypothetical protein
MNDSGKSDGSVVPAKRPNEAGRPVEEVVEGRAPAKGNPPQRNAPRTQSRTGALSALERIRQAARKEKKARFTALLHHVYDIERLRVAYLALELYWPSVNVTERVDCCGEDRRPRARPA